MWQKLFAQAGLPDKAKAPGRKAARHRAPCPQAKAGVPRVNRLQMLCRRALCVPIRIYQYTLSPWIGRSCRFSPSCSNYTMQAILTHGCIKGILLGAWRIARCNPLGKWGYDPVPPPGRWQSPARNLQPASCLKSGTGDKLYENPQSRLALCQPSEREPWHSDRVFG